MAQAAKEHERVPELEAQAKLRMVDPFDKLKADMEKKNPQKAKKAAEALPKGLVAAFKRQRQALGPVHSAEEAYGHITAVVKDLEMALTKKDSGTVKKLIRKIALVALCSETWSKGKE